MKLFLLTLTIFIFSFQSLFSQSTACMYVQEAGTVLSGYPSDYSEIFTCGDDFFIPANETWGIYRFKANFITAADPTVDIPGFEISFFGDVNRTIYEGYTSPDVVTASYISPAYDDKSFYEITMDLFFPTTFSGGLTGRTYYFTLKSSNTDLDQTYYWQVDTLVPGNYGLNGTMFGNGNQYDLYPPADFVYTIYHAPIHSDTVTVCESYTWTNGDTYTYSYPYFFEILPGAAANGCDSLTTLDLTIIQNGERTDTIAACDSYTWINGVTYTASNTTAQYAVPNASPNGCDSIITLHLTIFPESTSQIMQNPNGTLLIGNGAGFQWINCTTGEEIAGQTNVLFTPTANGSYAAVIETENGCSDTTDCVLVDYLDLNDNELTGISLYPNPVKDVLKISGQYEQLNYEIIDMSGKNMLSGVLKSGNSFVETTNFTKGVYLVKLKNESGVQTLRFIKE